MKIKKNKTDTKKGIKEIRLTILSILGRWRLLN